MLELNWRKISFRSWIFWGMALAILPLAISAAGGYFVLKHGVIERFQDVTSREHRQVGNLQRLQLKLREIAEPVDRYVDENDPSAPGAYRALRQQIELSFANLSGELAGEPEALALLERARSEWGAADAAGTEVMSARRPAADQYRMALLQKIYGRISAAVDKLGAATVKLHQEIDQDFALARLAYERTEWIAGIAAVVSLQFVLLGVYVIGRSILNNVDRLVEGANRFADGDRKHRIEIEVPKELRRVAHEFNRMITRIRETEQALAEQASRDALTGLLNRRSFDEALAESMARVNRLQEPFALCYLDLDHFKRVNDTFGHAAGDTVLRSVAQAMTLSIREIDKAFRIGGEEFAIILPRADETAAALVAERLRAQIASQPVKTESGDISITISQGIALSPPASDSRTLMEAADKALYRAKSEGRNCVRLDGETEPRQYTRIRPV